MNFATIGYMFDLEPKSVYNWYRNYLSGFKQAVESGEFHKYDLKHSDKSQLPVPILEPENMGESMVVDEKMINEKMYTIISNKDTGRIALLAQTMRLDDLIKLSEHFGEKLNQVKFVNCDMSATYKKFCTQVFTKAKLTVDKFHVISHVLDTLQAVRNRLKTSETARLPSKKRTTEMDEKTDAETPKEKQIETNIEMLTRSRYLLFKRAQDWTPWQAQMANQLFEHFPLLEKAHQLVEQVRDWYDRENVGKKVLQMEKKLLQWIENVEIANIPEMKGLSKMFVKHYDSILNYAITGQTNAKAENINSRIQRFINVNYGVRDEDFFFFRLKKYYT